MKLGCFGNWSVSWSSRFVSEYTCIRTFLDTCITRNLALIIVAFFRSCLRKVLVNLNINARYEMNDFKI
jgi:hypothetical protein